MNRGKLAAARAVSAVDGLVLADADAALVAVDADTELGDAPPNDVDAVDADADADANVDTELVEVDVVSAVAAGCDPSKECRAARAA